MKVIEQPMAVVATAFGTTTAMSAIAYFCRIPPAATPGPVVLGLMLACLLVGGLVAGRYAHLRVRGGAIVGVVSGALNLLILGSLITSSGAGDVANEVVPSRLLWIPGSLVASGILAAIGAVVGSSIRSTPVTPEGWRTVFVTVAASATLLLLVAGGLVTSLDAGLAVPDWPNTFGTNMFLYPLARMTGGIYFEHTHRLYGALVGLTTIVLAATVIITDRRRWLQTLAVVAVVMVIGQGVLGGLRVTGTVTLSDDPAVMTPSLPLAIVHGVFGQVFFVTITLLWAFLSRTWREAPALGESEGEADTRRGSGLASTVLVLTLMQVVFGAMYRHLVTDETPMPWPAHAHLTLALVVTVFAVIAGLKATTREPAIIKRFGRLMLVLVTLQVVLGIAAFIPLLARRADWRTIEVILATAHQANGALFLATAAQLVAWQKRLV